LSHQIDNLEIGALLAILLSFFKW